MNRVDEIGIQFHCGDEWSDYDFVYRDWAFWQISSYGNDWNEGVDATDNICPIMKAFEDRGVVNDNYSTAGTRVWRLQYKLRDSFHYEGKVYYVY